jgi:BirA family biotin operon repressor/biotin-[acetyl-CoA-carboxylase] ligase
VIEQHILSILKDGRFHSGEAIAKQLALSRTAVWKHIEKLKSLGANIYSVRGKGYRIPGGLDLLDETFLRENLGSLLGSADHFQLFTNIASTNQYLLSLESSPLPRVCMAEYQSTGRGRLGRPWHSPFARNIYLSMRHALPLSIDALSGLSLAVGCCVAECLRELGASGVYLKWPNDLKIEQKKLGGILVEVAGQTTIGAELVIGVGINWDMPLSDDVGQPWTNLKPLVKHGLNRNQLAVALVRHMLDGLKLFSEQGFTAFAERWSHLDGLLGKSVRLISGTREICGTYLGVDHAGALRIQTDAGVEICYGGELSLRACG